MHAVTVYGSVNSVGVCVLVVGEGVEVHRNSTIYRLVTKRWEEICTCVLLEDRI